MTWLQKIARPEIWALTAYKSARSEMQGLEGMIQIDANENPYHPYPQNNEVKHANRYPDPQPKSLLHTLANIYRVKPDQVLLARGMDEIIDLIVRVFCIPYQDKILITTPTYGMYQVSADIAGIDVIKVPFRFKKTELSLATKSIISKAKEHAIKIIFLCTPNNPTGNLIELKEIAHIAKSLPNTIIAVDEAYIEFADSPSATTLLDKHQNIVVMRTLSKAYGFAGVRLGSLLASPEIIQLTRKVLAPYPLPQPCVRLASQLLSPMGLQLINSRIDIIIQERERMLELLAKLPDVQVYPSKANFILLKVANASKCYADLLASGIIARNRSSDIKDTIRLSIGTPEENNLILACFGIMQHITKVDRTATIVRNTNETKINIEVNLDKSAPIKIHTGIGFFDHMLEQLAKHGGFSLQISAIGDTHIDYHHTVEDIAISLGQAIKQALGDKRGINRYGFVLPMDESCAFATLDLSGRGVLVYEANYPTPMIGDFPTELVEHFFQSLSDQLEAAIHLAITGENSHHMVEGAFKAFAKALHQAIIATNDEIPSTKGVL